MTNDLKMGKNECLKPIFFSKIFDWLNYYFLKFVKNLFMRWTFGDGDWINLSKGKNFELKEKKMGKDQTGEREECWDRSNGALLLLRSLTAFASSNLTLNSFKFNIYLYYL